MPKKSHIISRFIYVMCIYFLKCIIGQSTRVFMPTFA